MPDNRKGKQAILLAQQRVQRRASLFIRLTVGLLCGAMLILVVRELLSGAAHYATVTDDRPNAYRREGHVVSTPEGLLLFALSFGLPCLVGVLVALFPRLFFRSGCIAPILAITLLAALLLRFSH